MNDRACNFDPKLHLSLSKEMTSLFDTILVVCTSTNLLLPSLSSQGHQFVDKNVLPLFSRGEFPLRMLAKPILNFDNGVCFSFSTVLFCDFFFCFFFNILLLNVFLVYFVHLFMVSFIVFCLVPVYVLLFFLHPLRSSSTSISTTSISATTSRVICV